MTGLSGLLSGWTMRILVPLTLLDDCLVRAIALFLAAPLVDISINQPGAAFDGRAAASGLVPSAQFSSALAQRSQLAERSARVSRQESPGSSWKRLLTGVPDLVNCTRAG